MPGSGFVGLLRAGESSVLPPRVPSRSPAAPPAAAAVKPPRSGVVKASEEQPLNIAGPSCTWALHRQAQG